MIVGIPRILRTRQWTRHHVGGSRLEEYIVVIWYRNISRISQLPYRTQMVVANEVASAPKLRPLKGYLRNVNLEATAHLALFFKPNLSQLLLDLYYTDNGTFLRSQFW